MNVPSSRLIGVCTSQVMIITAMVSQRACQVTWIGECLDPALPADELDGADPVPVGERQHQHADQRDEGERDEEDQRRKHQDAEPGLRAAWWRARFQHLGLPGLDEWS